MIPYLEIHVIPVGPVNIQVWGLFVAIGIAAALRLGVGECRRLKLDVDAFLDLALWSLLGAFAGARLAHALAYDPAVFAADPFELLRVWHGGFSSIGGFIGGVGAGIFYARRRKLDVRAYANVAAFILPLGYGIGRIGCFLIHDHPGTLSHSLLAVRYPDGPRLDHGLLLSLLGFAIFGAFLALRKYRPGVFFPAAFIAMYAPVRFLLDFYRVGDARYWGLTPAQIFCAAAIITLPFIRKKYVSAPLPRL
ncbi:prolipoprotein diacylglyceryl transferase [Candidatus Uhrbacteria bacterium]|nr:prolipoprotein diacylglyceryl transferase [Candidatus Uhrbacteria bacterium]